MPKRPVHLPLYAVVILVLGSTLGPVLSITASVKIAEHNTAVAVARQEQAKAEAREQSRLLVCAFFSAQLDVWDETPPMSAAGKNLRKTNLEFYTASGCQPPRK
jgi:hypothetical protein